MLVYARIWISVFHALRARRGTWDCAGKSKDAGIPTLVVWGAVLFPFGHPGMDLLRRDAERKGVELGTQGQRLALEAWLPF